MMHNGEASQTVHGWADLNQARWREEAEATRRGRAREWAQRAAGADGKTREERERREWEELERERRRIEQARFREEWEQERAAREHRRRVWGNGGGGTGTQQGAPGRTALEQAFAVLGVCPSATIKECKRAYRRLAFTTHPDRNPGDGGAASRFQKILGAWRIVAASVA